MSKIAIDLTPLRAGGVNGGAKWLIYEWLRRVDELPAHYQFLLLTSSWNDAELAQFDSPRMQRKCVLMGDEPSQPPEADQSQLLALMHRFRPYLPLPIAETLRPFARRFKQRVTEPVVAADKGGNLLQDAGISLLFCPFTDPQFAEPTIPTVVFVHDLLHRAYPQFLSADEVAHREAFFAHAAQCADIFICNSEFTRDSLLSEYPNIRPEQCAVIPILLANRLNQVAAAETDLPPRPFLLYPANFWPHKNHRMLLTAFNMLCHHCPEIELDLLFTGSEMPAQATIKNEVQQMGLSERIHFAGHVSEGELRTFYESSLGLIFPSLYEGFGMPLLEAFDFNKPVLCAAAGSLPEVGGAAVLTFDPRKPAEMMQVMRRLASEPILAAKLAAAGRKRLDELRLADGMMPAYTRQFSPLLNEELTPIQHHQITGLYKDGWLGPQVEIKVAPHHAPQLVRLRLLAPGWLPHEHVSLHINASGTSQHHAIQRGAYLTVAVPLPAHGGRVELSFSPTYQPSQVEQSDDYRILSCQCQRCDLYSENQRIHRFIERETDQFPKGRIIPADNFYCYTIL